MAEVRKKWRTETSSASIETRLMKKYSNIHIDPLKKI